MNGPRESSTALFDPHPVVAVQKSAPRTYSLGSTPLRMTPEADVATSGTGSSPEQLVLQFLGVADALSRGYRATGCEAMDLQQVARLGLVKAASRYCESKGHGFIAYAVATITGELKRYVRDHSWIVRPPRRIQEARLAIRRVRPELIQLLGHYPSPADLSSAAGLSMIDTVQALLAETGMVAQQLEPYDLQEGHYGLCPGMMMAEEDPGFDRIDLQQSLEAALVGTSPKERLLLYLRFDLELSQEQIAEEFGVSQMQVSRLLKELLSRLERRLS